MGADQYESAIRTLRGLIVEHPDFGHAYESLAEAYLFVGDNAAARAYFGGIVEADPTNPYAHYGLAQVELREGNVDRAIE